LGAPGTGLAGEKRPSTVTFPPTAACGNPAASKQNTRRAKETLDRTATGTATCQV